jgi:uncharacterized protein
MDDADGWFMCRAGYVETVRAVGLAAGKAAAKTVSDEWRMFGVVEMDQPLAEAAAELALEFELRSLDALHLAAALVLPHEDLTLTTWDRRLHAAAIDVGLRVIPATLP